MGRPQNSQQLQFGNLKFKLILKQLLAETLLSSSKVSKISYKFDDILILKGPIL